MKSSVRRIFIVYTELLKRQHFINYIEAEAAEDQGTMTSNSTCFPST